MQFGLVNAGKVIQKLEKDFSEQEKKQIEKTIEEMIVNSINKILIDNNLNLNEIKSIRNWCTTEKIKME